MKTRNSNFELLRILSMFMIIAHHYSVHGHFEFIYGIRPNNMLLDFLYLGGQIGVILFVLISGYYMIHSEFKLKKLFKLELQILFYSIIVALFFYLFRCDSVGTLTVSNLVQSLFPTINYTYWFSTTYIVLYLMVPYLNKLLLSIKKKDFINLLILGLLGCILIPTFAGKDLGIGRVLYFAYFYSIGAYFKLYPIKAKKLTWLLFSILSYFFLFLTTQCFQILANYDPSYSSSIYYFAGINSFIILFISISIFGFFQSFSIKNNRLINTIASTTFGIYLIHDNPYMRNFLWITVFKNNIYYFSHYLLIHALVSIILVFAICTLIDLCRQRFFQSFLFPYLHKIYDAFLKD